MLKKQGDSQTNHGTDIFDLDDDECFDSFARPDFLKQANQVKAQETEANPLPKHEVLEAPSKPSHIKPFDIHHPYSASDLQFLWMTEDKKDHQDTETDKNPESSGCPSGEVLLQRALNVKTLTKEEEDDLIYKAKFSEDPLERAVARDELLTRNLRLCLRISKQYARISNYKPIELINWACLGMAHALDKFEFKKGARFSTYASFWIKQDISRGIANSKRSIRVPYNIITEQNQLKKFCREFSIKTGVEPEDEDILDYFGWNADKLEYIRKGMVPISSVNLPATDGDETIQDLIEDEGTSVEDEACSNIKREVILRIIDDTLDARAKDVLLNLYDFNEGRSLNRDQLAEKYHVTRERILQIRDESISKLRHPAKSSKLRGFLH